MGNMGLRGSNMHIKALQELGRQQAEKPLVVMGVLDPIPRFLISMI